MDTKKMSCEELIDKALKARIADFKEGLESEDFIAWINDYALWYGDDPEYRAKRLELSAGGPQDYFLFYTESDKIVYWYLDWFDGASRVLRGEAYRIMAKVRDILFDLEL